MIVLAVLFALTWLKEVIPDARDGGLSTSAVKTGLPTNPVHVLDLGFFIPAVLAVGIALRRGNALAFAFARALLVFAALTAAPAIATPVADAAQGTPAAWGILALMVPRALVALSLTPSFAAQRRLA